MATSRQDASADQTPNQARRFFVSGRVQGVGYRFFAQNAAEQLGVSGYAKNLADGRVEVYAIADPKVLDVLGRELRRGPRFALVERVEEQNAEIDPRYAGSWGFSID